MLASLIFIFFRLMELLTLIPVIGMLAYFVNIYVNANALTPTYILTLFIVATIAGVWALVTLFRRGSVRRNAAFVAFIDLCFVGAFIAGAYELRGIAGADCSNVYGGFSSSGGLSTSSNGNSASATVSPVTINYQPYGIDINKTCAMLKASFAFAIMNCIFFAITSLMALLMHRRENVVVEKYTRRSSSHGSRRGHHHHTHRSSSRDSRRNYYV